MTTETDRLLLVSLDETHTDYIFKYFTDTITVYMYPCAAKHRDETEAFVKSALKQREEHTDYVFEITRKSDGDFLGLAGLHKLREAVPELGIWTKQEAHGHHYGREAVGILVAYAKSAGILKLRYPVDRRNTASKKIPLYYGGVLTETKEQITPDGRTLQLEVYELETAQSRPTIQSFPYNEASAAKRTEIAQLLSLVWPKLAPDSQRNNDISDNPPQSHAVNWNAQSFCAYTDGILSGYVAAVQKTVRHLGKDWNMAGLSCVATRPDCRKQGTGGALVREASRWITSQPHIDFGIFTCQPSLAAFYTRAGGWKVIPQAILLGGRKDGSLSSETLGVSVLARLFSERAKQNACTLFAEPISLGLPAEEFL